jgi:hypothetical protein
VARIRARCLRAIGTYQKGVGCRQDYGALGYLTVTGGLLFVIVVLTHGGVAPLVSRDDGRLSGSRSSATSAQVCRGSSAVFADAQPVIGRGSVARRLVPVGAD